MDDWFLDLEDYFFYFCCFDWFYDDVVDEGLDLDWNLFCHFLFHYFWRLRHFHWNFFSLDLEDLSQGFDDLGVSFDDSLDEDLDRDRFLDFDNTLDYLFDGNFFADNFFSDYFLRNYFLDVDRNFFLNFLDLVNYFFYDVGDFFFNYCWDLDIYCLNWSCLYCLLDYFLHYLLDLYDLWSTSVDFQDVVHTDNIYYFFVDHSDDSLVDAQDYSCLGLSFCDFF